MRLFVVIAVLLCWVGSGHAAAPPGDKRELLSDHDTVAKFVGTKAVKCRGLTALCPEDCGHSGDMATFEVVAYVAYEKKGQYGDPKSKQFVTMVQDNKGNAKLPKAVADKINALQAGDLVRLHWRHDYVSRTEAGGGVSKFPDRPIVSVEKLTQAEADKLAKEAKE
ncbi:MAG: hypothetical protein ACAI43_05445 [Phycisphaerae bacterium]|nr:hypothetical protein [Tepidisphaeraceae bacterium]